MAGASARYRQMIITAIPTGGDIVAMSQATFYNSSNAKITGITITANKTSLLDGPENLGFGDGNGGGWAANTPVTVSYDFGTATAPTKLRVAQMSSAPQNARDVRIPASFTIQSSNDQSTWVTELTVTNDAASGYIADGSDNNHYKNFALSNGVTALTVSGTAGSGTVGQNPTEQWTASGGTAPYTYSVGSGALPPGRTLNTTTGVVTGAFTTAGSFTYVIHAVDSGV